MSDLLDLLDQLNLYTNNKEPVCLSLQLILNI